MQKRIRGAADNVTTDVVLLVGAGLAVYFLIIKPGVNILGLGAESGNVTDQKNLPGPANPLNYQFQPFIDFYNNNTPTINGQSGSAFSWQFMTYLPTDTQNNNPTIQQFFQYLKANPGNPSPWGYLNTVDLSQRAESLYNALTVALNHQILMSDQQSAMSALSGLSNQLQVAFLANYFWWNFNTDLLNFLQGGLFGGGLTDANLSAFISNVNNLPVNPS